MIFVTCLFWADLHLFYSRLPSNIFCCLLSLLYIIAVHSFTAISAHSAPSSSILLMKSKWQDVSWEKDSKYRRKKKQQQLIFPFLRRLFMFGPSCKRTCNLYSQPQTYFIFFFYFLYPCLSSVLHSGMSLPECIELLFPFSLFRIIFPVLMSFSTLTLKSLLCPSNELSKR